MMIYLQDSSPIELLIGADVAGKLFTGQKKILKCGLVAIETVLGWALMGKVLMENLAISNRWAISMITLSLNLNDITITNLWKLDALGNTEPSEKKDQKNRWQLQLKKLLKFMRKGSMQ